MAIRLNPFNMDARVASFVELIGAEDPARAERIDRLAKGALRFSPGDARAYSMMGEVEKRRGDRRAASDWFAHALRHSKTEIRALLHQLQEALTARDMDIAMTSLDLILRRWPQYWGAVAPIVPALAEVHDGGATLRRALGESPPWRSRVIQHLLTTAPGLAFVEGLILEDMRSGTEPRHLEINSVISALIRRGALRRAYQLHLSTLSAADRERFGYVFNSQFLPDSNRGYFRWRIGPASGAETSSGEGLRLRFHDAPTRLGNVSQVISLPPGEFNLTAVTSATQLAAPKDLLWKIECFDRRVSLAELVVPEGTYASRPLTSKFAIPFDGCPLQSLTLKTALTVDSWRFRYRGAVLFESVTITKTN